MNRYQKYLKSNEWRERRKTKLESVGNRCEWCGEKEKLTVHHKHYKTLGNESNKDLLVLCPGCHWIADRTREGKDTKLMNKYLKAHDKPEEQRHRERKQNRQAKRRRKS